MNAPPSQSVVKAIQLRKSYGDVEALCGVDLEVGQGEILGLLGPNGAGKTTLIEVLLGLRRPSSGSAYVLGVPIGKALAGVRADMGVATQKAASPPLLSTRELLSLHAAFYPRPRDPETLIDQLGLRDKADVQSRRLSGGQARRLAIGLALVGRPALLFLDEPTSELDPHARLAIWDLLLDPAQRSRRSIIVSTHQMEEAARLCTRVAIIDHGQILALDTPSALIERFCPGHRVVFQTTRDARIVIAGAVVEPDAGASSSTVSLRGTDLEAMLNAVMSARREAGFVLNDLRVERHSLEDVFVKLTGRRMRS